MNTELFKRTPQPVLAPRKEIPWASSAVFNPGVWDDNRTIHLLFRAIPEGYKKIPLDDPDPSGPKTGFDDYVSYIGYASSSDGVHFDWRDEPFIDADAPFDRYGAEDARISKIDDTFLITYTALSEPAFGATDGVRIGLATTKDFRTVVKHGVVGPPVRDKDAVIFPERIGGKIGMLHRVVPNVQLVWFDSLDQLYNPPASFWENHMAHLEESVVMGPLPGWEEKKVGAGPTPLKTDEGWLMVYHGVDQNHVYRAGLALLDLDDPSTVIARLPYPVFEPKTEWELFGDVNNVVFPEGNFIRNGTVHLYYGAADLVIGHAQAKLSDLLAALKEDGK